MLCTVWLARMPQSTVSFSSEVTTEVFTQLRINPEIFTHPSRPLTLSDSQLPLSVDGIASYISRWGIMKFFALMCALLWSVDTYGATNNLPDCSQATVQNAINSSSDGDVVACPAGSWSWSNVDLVNRNITLQGGGIGITKISITAGGGIEATSSNTKAFRITGFTFASTANFGTDSGWAAMMIQGGHDWRIDHNRFEIYANVISYDGGNGIYTRNDVSGLIDHNEFVKGGGSGCMHASVYPEGAGNTAWGWASQIGSSDHTVFIEDNYFYNPDACSAHNAHAVYSTARRHLCCPPQRYSWYEH